MGKKVHLTKKRGNPYKHKKHTHHKKNGNQAIGVLRGLENENLAIRALKEKFKKPAHYLGWRKATSEEDYHESTDIFIHTPFCDVRIDIKSSEEFARKKEGELMHVGMHDVVVVVVKSHMSTAEVRAVLFEKVAQHIAFKFGRALQLLQAVHRRW